MELNNRAIIRISPELIIGWLQYDGGVLLDARVNQDVGYLELIIQHEDFPRTEIGSPVTILTPSYRSNYGDNGCLMSVTRES